MKKTITFTLLLLAVAFAKAQTAWPPIGAEWYYSFSTFNYSDPEVSTRHGYVYLKAQKNTVKNDTACVEIGVTYFPSTGGSEYLGEEYLYSSGDSVFSFHDGHFYLLYDFSLNVGDTCEFFLGSNCSLYGKIGHGQSRVTVTYEVADKGYSKIGDTMYEYIRYNYLYDSKYALFHLGNIYKGIGNEYFLFGSYQFKIDGDMYGPLRCYSDETTSYTTEIPCDYLPTGIEAVSKDASVVLLQNPVESNVELRISAEASTALENVEVLSIEGDLLASNTFSGKQTNVSIPVHGLPAGIYIYKALFAHGEAHGLFVKK